MQAPTHTGHILNLYHFLSLFFIISLCSCQGELSPQIEEVMLQYVSFNFFK